MSSSVRPGDVLAGKYRVERVLGQGGMGYVVAARHLQLDQMVAMKFLRHDGGGLDETEATGRFLREAKATVRLRNEHVAKVFDVGTLESGEPYIVMEYLDGADLSTLSKQQGHLPFQDVVEFILQACEALAEAHSLGIVHRDIKLANLFISRGPTGGPLLKVLDFGISKVNPFGESEQEMTRTSSMLGSPRFMSPEQMRDARSVDARTDIWSLGVVMYRLIAGRAPFEAETLGRLLTMVMHERHAPLDTALPGLPPGLGAIVDRCLEKDVVRRFTSVNELASALVPYAAEPTHARAAADRIAATIGASTSISFNLTGPTSQGNSGRISAPPGSVDTHTAAPWSGTGGRRSVAPGKSSSVAWIAVVVAGALVAGTVALFHADALKAAGASTPPVATADPPAIVVAPVVTTPAASPASTSTGTSTSASTDTTATTAHAPAPSPTKPASMSGEDKPQSRRPVPQTPPGRRPTSAPRPNDGIPSTRD